MKTAAQHNFEQIGHSEFTPATGGIVARGTPHVVGESSSGYPLAPFFSTAERRQQFADEIKSWFGTPFVAQANIRGAGVDCVNVGKSSYAACGLVIKKELPAYTMDGGKHQTESQLIKWIEASGRFVRIGDRTAVGEVKCGDTLCFRMYRSLSAHHTGYAIGGTEFGHCLFRREFRRGDLRDKTFVNWLEAIYRPIV